MWLRQAALGLDQMAEYIAEDKPDAARRFVREVMHKTKRLGSFPSLGLAGRLASTHE